MKKYQIRWSPEAKDELKEIYNYLKKKSLQGSTNVKNAIIDTVESLEEPLLNYPYDPYLGEPYRYVVVKNYKHFKIIHIKTANIIDILSIFNTWQDTTKLTSIKNR